MPEKPYTTSEELKRLLKLERLQHTTKRDLGGRTTMTPERELRKHNAEDLLAAVTFIEQRAPRGVEMKFETGLVEELKGLLPALSPDGEIAERMGAILDALQLSVTEDEGKDALADPANRASSAFHAHQKHSAHKREDASRQREKRRR